MASSLFFAGHQYVTPVTVSAVDDTAMVPTAPAGGNNLAIVGLSDGGKPNVPLRFSSPAEAKAVLVSGELLTAVNKAFAPSAATGSPRTITAVRVGAPTRSTLTLKDASAANAIVLTSTVYGLPANQITVAVEAGTSMGQRVTLRLGTTYTVGDNLARDAFTVHYTGAGAAATIDVTATSVVLKSGTGGSLVTDATILFVNAPTVQQVVDRINAVTGYTASAAPVSSLKPAANGLDFATAVDIKTAAVTIGADLQAVVDYLNSANSKFVTAVRATGAGAVPALIATTYLSGATYPTVLTEDWSNAIDILENVDAQHIVPLSGDAAVHAMAAAHAQFMSTASMQERRAVVGGPAGVSIEEAQTRALAIADDRTSFAWPAHYDYDILGTATLQPGYMTAVLVAAAHAAINPGTALTNKPLAVAALEINARVPSDTDGLIQSGVLVVAPTATGNKVIRDISTWLADNNFNRVENSCGAALDFVVRAVRDVLDPLRGGPQTPQSMARAKTVTTTCLMGLAKQPPVGPGVIVGDAKSPAFSNVEATINGDVLGVSFQCSPVVPNNFITVGVVAVPYSGSTASAS